MCLCIETLGEEGVEGTYCSFIHTCAVTIAPFAEQELTARIEMGEVGRAHTCG